MFVNKLLSILLQKKKIRGSISEGVPSRRHSAVGRIPHVTTTLRPRVVLHIAHPYVSLREPLVTDLGIAQACA